MPAERTAPVAGVVLAAGASTRMGENKLLFELEGESLVRRAVTRALGVGLDPVVVVLGHDAERVGRELIGLRCRTVLNPDHACGVNGSLKTGVGALPPGTGAVVVMLADMPFVTSAMLVTLVERYRTAAVPLVVSDYDGVNAPPMLYDRALFQELLMMEGEGCGKQVVNRHRDEAAVAAWPAAALADIDVPDDYARLRSRLASG